MVGLGRDPKRKSYDAIVPAAAGSRYDSVVSDMLDSLHLQLSNHHRVLLASARTFLPDIVVEAINSNQLQEDQTIVSKCDGAVVFSDASGFTALTERLAEYSNGAELLSKCLNKFFTPLIDMLTAYRGDVIKFSGDALTILFASTNDHRDYVHACGSPSCVHEPLELACLRASACCIEIHKRLHNFDTGEGDVKLTMHIGVGAGPVTILQVGGSQFRYEYVIAGQPLAQIAIAEPLAGSGETVLSPECWIHVKDTVIEGAPIESQPDYHRLASLNITKHTYPTVKQAAQQSCITRNEGDEDLDDDELERRLRMSTRFIPRSVMKQLRTGSLRGVNEMRTVSIIFVQIGGVDVSTDAGSRTAKHLMNGMQSVSYSEEGSLNKFLVDDKGLLFLFVFGLPPLVHVDDPVRATRACMLMTELLIQMDLTGRIGITTGRVYCGIVGSDTRKEYTVMGDTVNLSARLMANAEANTVLVDDSTYKRCKNEFTFLKFAPIKVKGKENKIPIYRPVREDAPTPPPSSATGNAQLKETLVKQAGRTYVLKAKRAPPEKDLHMVLPWAPKSTLFGGKSPVQDVKSWRHMVRAEELVANRLKQGGGSLLFLGESGCGKEELTETLLQRLVEEDGMMPIFGSMQMRANEKWAAAYELICCLLSVLHRETSEAVYKMQPSALEQLAALENLSEEETKALRKIGLASGPSTAGQAIQEEHRRSVSKNSVMSGAGFQAVGEQADQRHAVKFKRSSTVDTALHKAVSDGGQEYMESLVVALAKRLLQKLLLSERVVLTLRCWRGTSLSPCDTFVFWSLVRELSALASQQERGRLVVLVLSRYGPNQAVVGQQETACSTIAKVKTNQSTDSAFGDGTIEMGAMDDAEAKALIALLLGVDGPDSVPQSLIAWLSSITLNNPRNIQEVLSQLREEEKLKVTNGAVSVLADLDSVDIAAWVHTGMVGSIISQIEIMGAEAQRVIKMATVFDGAFSALDVAAANRVHRPDSDILAFHDSVQLLMSCEWLVSQNFLRRDDYGKDEKPHDGQTWRMPRWSIANLLIRKVVGATLLQSQKMQIKRAVLLTRRLNIDLPERMKAKMAMRERLFGKASQAEKIRQQRRKEQSASQWESQIHAHGSGEATFSGLPSSCIVLPVRSAQEMGFSLPSRPGGYGVGDLEGTMVTSAMINAPAPDPHRLNDWLCIMSASGQKARVAHLLKRGASTSHCDGSSLTPLHFACFSGDLEVVKTLIQSKAEPSAQSPMHGTPLEVAIAQGHLEIVEFFVQELGGVSVMSMEKWQESLEHFEAAELPSLLAPSLASDVSAWNQIEEANYRRSQTLLFVQDCISLLEEERQEKGMPSRRSKAIHANKAEIPTGPTTCLKELASSKMKKYLLTLLVMVALIGPDLWIVTDGSQTSLDNWLSIAVFLFTLDIALNLTVDVQYRTDLLFVMDVVGTIALAFEISWMAGPKWNTDYMTPDTPLDGRKGSYSANLALTARSGDLLVRAARYFTVVGRIVNAVLNYLFWRRSEPRSNFGGVEKFRRQLLHTITMHVAVYTTLLVVILPLINYMLLPNADLSMEAWAAVLTGYMPSGVAASPEARTELSNFGSFYEKLPYGPFRVCGGDKDSHGNIQCGPNGLLWSSEVDAPNLIFEEPNVAASRLDMKSSVLELSFDFTKARLVEAKNHVSFIAMAVCLMMMTTLFISNAVCDLVLRPLQRMLTSAKEVAKPIFGDSSAFGLSIEDDLDDEQLQDEVLVLEKIVEKLGKIAGIAANLTATLEEKLEGLEGEDRGVMQMLFQKEDKQKPQEGTIVTGGIDAVQQHFEMDPTPGREMQIRLEQLDMAWEQLDSWDFNCLHMDPGKQNGIVGWILLQNTSTFGDIQLAPDTTANFLQKLQRNYRAENAFHNWCHAVDVQHTLWRMILISEAHKFLTGLNQFSLLISAIGHDVGHFGLNNNFLIETCHELTVRYNDRSPLENMHCSKLFEIVSGTPGVNIFEPLTKAQFFEVRRICVETILHTDMVHHFDMVKETQMLYQMNSDVYEEDLVSLFRERETKTKIMNLFVHSADISNPCKPWKVTHEWAMRCLAEFFDQGDKELEMGVPVQMLNDRSKVNKPFSQIGFVEFMIAPLEAAKTMLFPMLNETTAFLETNIQNWKRVWIEENNPADDEREKVTARVSKVCQTLFDARHVHYLQNTKELDRTPRRVSTGGSTTTSNDFPSESNDQSRRSKISNHTSNSGTPHGIQL